MTNPDLNTSRGDHGPSRLSCLLGLGVVAMAFALAAALTWRKWPDVLIDFGTQLYIPWRLLNGAVLYRDLFYFAGGPFSQYFNALLFKIFGVSFSTLIFANLVFSAAILFVIYRRFLAAADVWTATLLGLGVVFVFAFAEYTPISNYNYITPYSHEAFHGLVLSIFAIALLSDWIKNGKIWTVAAAGFCAGLVFLTKPDIFTALAIAMVAAFVVSYLMRQGKGMGKSLAAFLAAVAIPPLFFFFYFLCGESLHDSVRSVVFGWLPLLHGTVTKSPFYIWCLGLDQPRQHLKEIILYFAAVAGGVVVYAFILWAVSKVSLKWVRFVVQVALLLPLLYGATRFQWIQCGWPLPLLCLSACVLIAWNFKKLEQPVFPLLWSLFGLALMAKLGLFPRIWHYGFILAMPAFVSSVYLLFWLLPHLLERKFAIPAGPFRLLAGSALLIGYFSLFEGSGSLYAQKTFALGSGGDTLYTHDLSSETSQGIATALVWSDKFMPTNATLAVIPQGIMLNYLTRRVNPAPEMDWNPTIFTVFGQERMMEAFETHPPDYIFIVEWDSSDFGAGYFGSSPDYGQGLMEWIGKNYQPQVLIGHEPLKDGRFGVKILKHISPPKAEEAMPARGGTI